jgi:membrane protease subunit HflC
MRKHVLTVIVGVLVGVSLLLYMFAFQVRENEVAVLLHFGKASKDLPQPGYHFKWPWPIEEVRKFDSRINVSESRLEETPTKDKRNITLSVCVGWRVSDPLAFNQNFGRLAEEERMQEAWSRVDGYLRDSALAVVGQHDLSDLVSVDRDKLKYDAIEASIVQAANEKATRTYGITFSLLKLRRLELPQSAMEKVFQRMIQERNLEATKIQEAGNAIAANIKASATTEKQELLALARKQATELEGKGDTEAAKYFDVFAKNPDLAIYLRKIHALQETLKTKTTVILDPSIPPFDLFSLGFTGNINQPSVTQAPAVSPHPTTKDPK